ncbi:hypothetical protein EUX98_g8721 [Antrodiella citrinella]|uniref:Uncharacterized protein n=1 Tax=Antrodiella citrinella TaxID=2447956 RepID=A0A4S4M3P7_9APHY|nr:hypothetical protein EUX98_g8721 [Antrodiella citrinella]
MKYEDEFADLPSQDVIYEVGTPILHDLSAYKDYRWKDERSIALTFYFSVQRRLENYDGDLDMVLRKKSHLIYKAYKDWNTENDVEFRPQKLPLPDGEWTLMPTDDASL